MKTGIVLKSTGSWYTVRSSDNYIVECKIRGKFRTKGIKTTNPIAVGDLVEYTIEDNIGIITNIKKRKNYIIRKSSNLSKEAHILAANVDQAFLVVTLIEPKTTTMFIDRFLVSAEAYRIPVSIIFNKVDLYDVLLKKQMDEYINIYTKIGYPCHVVSGLKKINIEIIKNVMKDKINIISGNSGVGKSTIINRIDPGLNIKTQKISEYHKLGKHTTTFSEMFELQSGGYIIDTPGIKGFGIVDIEKNELFHFFPEIFKSSENCRFHNCQHIKEPGCAVIEDVKSGKISESRYFNYLGILENDENKYRIKSNP